MLTKDELAEITERCEKATEGSWECADTTDGAWIIDGDGDIITGTTERLTDADFIAHAREDVPKLLAEVDRLKKALVEAGDVAYLGSHVDIYLAEIAGIIEQALGGDSE